MSILGFIVAYTREGASANLVTNLSWSIVNITLFIPFIKAALPEKVKLEEQSTEIQIQSNTAEATVND
ncbi:MAG: hypothetical protein HC932_04030 [Thermales bacterium]|nr:hypothetical protein [Thermales bacterium]